MQKIDNIEIKNFKSIRHQKIEGCKRINVFIGYPNVGKSNILEGIGLFSMCQEGEFDKTNNPSNPNEFTFDQICRISEPIDIFFNKNYKEGLVVSLNGGDVAIQSNYQDNFNLLSFQIIKPDAGYKIDHLHATLVSSINIDVKDFWIRFHPTAAFSKDEIYNRIKIYLFNDNYQNGFSNDFINMNMPYGKNISQIIYTNNDVRELFIEILKQNNLKPHLLTGKYGVAKEMPNGVIVTFDSNLMADTPKRLLFHAAAIKTNKNAVLLFEEPESHMFPPYISKFTNDIIFDKNDNQYFITTHSPYVLNDFMDNLKSDELAIYIVSYKKETGETEIHRMNEQDMHEAYQFGYDFFMNIDKFISQEQYD